MFGGCCYLGRIHEQGLVDDDDDARTAAQNRVGGCGGVAIDHKIFGTRIFLSIGKLPKLVASSGLL
jgi:hypothetical protein